LIKFQKKFLTDYRWDLSAREKKNFNRLVEDSEELLNNDTFSLEKFQKELEELTKQTKNLTKKYLIDSDDIAPLKAIFDENKAIRKKMKDLREQQERKKKEQEESDSHSSDS
jgi:replicative DNA helicase